MNNDEKAQALATLEWYVESGVTDVLSQDPVDKTNTAPVSAPASASLSNARGMSDQKQTAQKQTTMAQSLPESKPVTAKAKQPASKLMGTPEAIKKATAMANAATTLEELKQAIADFDGLSVKKTAQNLVFCDGHKDAKIMVIGEAPGADEDEKGKPFVGASGQLLDKIMTGIGLSRKAEKPEDAVYISNILNWRPPGNRTPTPAEMSIALPFIEKHIQLISPRVLILVGNTPMKSLLNTKVGIMKMRGEWHDYKAVSDIEGTPKNEILALPTFHPAFLLRNPMKKKTVWQDMILLQKKRIELGLVS